MMPLPEPMLTYYQRCLIWVTIDKMSLKISFLKLQYNVSRDNELMD